jgi:hypothetical protein
MAECLRNIFCLTFQLPFRIMMRGRAAADILQGLRTMAVVLKRERVRVAFTWGIAALFGAVMVCGEWLHCLNKFQHHAHFSQSNCGISEGASGDCESFDGRLFFGPSLSHCQASHDGDCAICAFLMQAHCLPVTIAWIGESRQVVESCLVSPRITLSIPICVYHSRAPPA